MKHLIPLEVIEQKILIIRGNKVLLDRDLARLYEVETRALNQAVDRNLKRFPPDFMLTLTKEEAASLVSRNVIPHIKYLGGHLPNAFTEQGVSMLSSVLNSERAIEVNILIMRTFVRLRELMSSHRDLANKIEELEKKYNSQFKSVFDAIKALMKFSTDSPTRIKTIHGFKPGK
ncbi:MAG: ORF6N domain-containing protein [Elusimicrobia bacterium]|nr:ORF6N domain-containing protein [Elusimicrobiota bacterium]